MLSEKTFVCSVCIYTDPPVEDDDPEYSILTMINGHMVCLLHVHAAQQYVDHIALVRTVTRNDVYTRQTYKEMTRGTPEPD